MRIGIDAHKAEDDGCGNCTYIRGLVRGLAEIDRENEYVLYVCDPGHPYFRGLALPPNFRLRRLRPRASFLRIPLALALASRRDRLDVLHVQYIAPPCHRGRLVATIHDLGFLRVPDTFPKPFVWRSRILVRATARRATRIITGSAHARDDIAATYRLDPARVAFIPHGVAPEFFTPRDPAATQRVLDAHGIRRPFILSVSRINPRKNIPLLAAAFRRLVAPPVAPSPRPQLVLVGKPDFDSGRTMSAVSAGIGPDLIATGYVPDEDLRHLYSSAAAFVYISLFEGAGLPVFEAMASGAPVVTTASTSMAELAAGTAVLVDPSDEEGLARVLRRLLEDSTFRADRIAAGRRRAAELTWREAALRTLEVYRAAAR
ncbi:MAG: glycosyltransferase family 1 protein [Candidatus Aminicenantes bacterium]|nr:glycosyltransferase family 1 protein [Candidatus Aminicenantes bacterium]